MAITTKQASAKWGISDRRVRILCANGQIDGAFRRGKIWMIPDGAPKPADGRIKSQPNLLAQILCKKAQLDKCRPLTEGEVARLTNDFVVQYTYRQHAHPARNRHGFAWLNSRPKAAQIPP